MSWFQDTFYQDRNNDLTELAKLRERSPLTQQQTDTNSYWHQQEGPGGLMSDLPLAGKGTLQVPGKDEDEFSYDYGQGKALAPAKLLPSQLPSLMEMSTQNYNKEDPFTQMPQGDLLKYLSLMSVV